MIEPPKSQYFSAESSQNNIKNYSACFEYTPFLA